MNIYSIYILKTTGICLYSRNFSPEFENLNIDLITPFFSAIFTFSKNAISRNLEVLEMNDLKFVFKVKNDFIFVLLANISSSQHFLCSSLEKISMIFLNHYENLGDNKDIEIIHDENFDKAIDLLIMGFEQENLEYYDRFDRIFKHFVVSYEILGATVLSTSGQVMFNSLPDEISIRALKELEFRFTKDMKDYPITINILKNQQKLASERIFIQKEDIDCVIILLLGSNITLGSAEEILKKITTRIKISF